MSGMPMYVAAGIAILLIVLGFAALLGQKIYMDSSGSSPVEIDIPLFGRMKANYPALAFVFLGCAMAVYGVKEFRQPDEHWRVDGTIAGVQGTDLQNGRITVFPSKVKTHLDPETGRFTIELSIAEGQTLEDVIEWIDFTTAKGSIQILPKQEMELKAKNGSSKLVSQTKTSRAYTAALNTFLDAN